MVNNICDHKWEWITKEKILLKFPYFLMCMDYYRTTFKTPYDTDDDVMLLLAKGKQGQ